jgi:hypothetical protein
MTRRNGTRTLYRIVTRSELSERYAAAFDGMQMETKDGETILIGEMIDQRHLFGILERINGTAPGTGSPRRHPTSSWPR